MFIFCHIQEILPITRRFQESSKSFYRKIHNHWCDTVDPKGFVGPESDIENIGTRFGYHLLCHVLNAFQYNLSKRASMKMANPIPTCSPILQNVQSLVRSSFSPFFFCLSYNQQFNNLSGWSTSSGFTTPTF